MAADLGAPSTANHERVAVDRTGIRAAATRSSWAARVALLLGAAGLGYRLVLTLFAVPPTNSDEATMGLAGMHILAGTNVPVYFYGQHYMGTLEAYLAVPLFALFGPGTLALRLPLLPMYAALLYLVWRLAASLYHPWLATLTVGLLALGADRVLKDQMLAGGGYPEISPTGALLILLALLLAGGRVRRVRLGFALFGLAAGFALWDDWLVVPYLGAACAVLLWGGRRLPRVRLVALAGGCFVLGLVPLLLDNLLAPPGDDTVSTFLFLSAPGTTPYLHRLHGAIMEGLPLASGACAPGRCFGWSAWFGPAYVVLMAVSGLLAVAGVWRARRPRGGDPSAPAESAPVQSAPVQSAPVQSAPVQSAPGESAPAESAPVEEERLRQIGRVALVGAAMVALWSYSRSTGAEGPVEGSRYLSMLQISTPALLWPLWLAAGRLRGARLSRGGGARLGAGVLGVAGIAAIAAVMVAATVALLGRAGAIHEADVRQRDLARRVVAAGIRYAYADYWTCNRLVFATREAVVCAVVADDLGPGDNRYRPYVTAVRAADRPAFVLPVDSPPDRALRAYLSGAGIAATVTTVDGYHIYRTDVTVRPPT